MSGWDEGQVYYSDQQAAFPEDETVDLKHIAQRKFADFLRNFREYSSNDRAIYMDMLDHDPPPAYIKVSLDDIHAHDKTLASALRRAPAEYLPLLETAASDIIASVRNKTDEAEGSETPRHEIQVMLTSSETPKSIRDLSSTEISKLVVLPGIVIAASRCKSKATSVTLICKNCKNTKSVPCKPGLNGVNMPRVCDANLAVAGSEQCPLDPFTVLPDRSRYIDQQVLKLQEQPEAVPTGELPRHLLVTVERNMVQKIVPGTKVTIVGIYSIFQAQDSRSKAGKAAVAIRQPYIRVVGIEENAEGNSRGEVQFTQQEIADYTAFAAQPRVIDALRAKIAPAIFGSENMKAAILCMLMGGSRKILPDGVRLRGDVNVLLLGDPSTAKSQFLKFVEKTAPIAVYTSGKGSSAAGLTASIIRDSQSGEAYLEGGAMVLADGGVVCIDEFDKMRPEDRVAIHEAMEQQTISIAKAGITTVLNSRCAVLAAANPPSGHYDDMKSAAENIDLQTTILSRFDLIFIVKDERNHAKDTALAQHVLSVHTSASKTAADPDAEPEPAPEGSEFDLKRYIQFCRYRVSPRLSATAAEELGREYVKIRQEQRQRNESSSADSPNPIPITVRQLEAIIRISESLARCSLAAEVGEEHVRESIRLFNISTMDAARAGISEGQLSEEQRQELMHVEEQIKRLLRVGGIIKERFLLDQITRQGVNEISIRKALVGMAQRGEIEFQNERKNVKRLI